MKDNSPITAPRAPVRQGDPEQQLRQILAEIGALVPRALSLLDQMQAGVKPARTTPAKESQK